jgi:alpha-N-arabinofuranosidase
VLTVTNSDAESGVESEIGLRGGRISNVRATVLRSSDIKAHNSFEHPDVVNPVTAAVSGGGTQLAYTFAPASVTKLEFDVGA